jgi:hypothetical protein
LQKIQKSPFEEISKSAPFPPGRRFGIPNRQIISPSTCDTVFDGSPVCSRACPVIGSALVKETPRAPLNPASAPIKAAAPDGVSARLPVSAALPIRFLPHLALGSAAQPLPDLHRTQNDALLRHMAALSTRRSVCSGRTSDFPPAAITGATSIITRGTHPPGARKHQISESGSTADHAS